MQGNASLQEGNDMITLDDILNQASPQPFIRGAQLYKGDCILEYNQTKTYRKIMISASVKGSTGKVYHVDMTYDSKAEEFVTFGCECAELGEYKGLCKHCVATAMKMLEMENQGNQAVSAQKPETISGVKQIPTDRAVTGLIYGNSLKTNARYLQPGTTGRVALEPVLHDSHQQWQVDFRVGAEKKYVLRNITDFIDNIVKSSWGEYGKKLGFYHDISAFEEQALPLIRFLKEVVQNETIYSQKFTSSYYSYEPVSQRTKRKLSLEGDIMVKFAGAMVGRSCQVGDSDSSGRTVTFVNQDPVLTVEIKDKENGVALSLPAVRVWYGTQQLCIHAGSYIYLCSTAYSAEMWDIAGLLEAVPTAYHINQEDLKSFCATVVPVLEQYTLLKKPPSVRQYEQKPCRIEYYLDRQNSCITAMVCGVYGEDSYNLMKPLNVKDMYRDIQKEKSAVAVAYTYFPESDMTTLTMLIPEEHTDDVYRFLTTGVQQLEQMGAVFISDALKRLSVMRSPKVTVGVLLSGGILDITLRTDRFDLDELKDILSNYRRRKKYYRLKNGDFLQLENSSLEAVAELAEGLELDAESLAGGHIELPEHRSFYLDQILREYDSDIQVKRNQTFKSFIRNMKNVEDSDYEVPDGLRADLRSYQIYGFRWLMTLDSLGLGGILADDMGLGKTIQAIAFLLARKAEGKVRALVVCPASLVYNWDNEIRRFTDDLTTDMVVGTAARREELLKYSEADVLLTSYDLLKRDIETYEEICFDYMIIDEAQNIKNHQTQAAKSVKAVKARRRFALTGTPVENSLSELWSIFDFLMPGFLYSYKRFRENYEQPITTQGDEIISERLRKMIRPFILRRLKKDVLKELPDKLEEVVYSAMEGEQQKLYTANAQQLLDSLADKTEEELNTGKIQILAELTKLRQLCCDPSLTYEAYKGGSAKLDTCMELIHNAVESGNKVLLFSQFTSMLDIIKAKLEQDEIPFYILTGQTSKEQRNELVQAFNQDATPIFLISLKAGGTGLNLTAASIVIHYDPWWNMAAQNQATDRAHRIGQEQVVTVYKLIVKHTIEEKILGLQEKKAALSEGIIADGSISRALGSKDELLELLRSGLEEL